MKKKLLKKLLPQQYQIKEPINSRNTSISLPSSSTPISYSIYEINNNLISQEEEQQQEEEQIIMQHINDSNQNIIEDCADERRCDGSCDNIKTSTKNVALNSSTHNTKNSQITPSSTSLSPRSICSEIRCTLNNNNSALDDNYFTIENNNKNNNISNYYEEINECEDNSTITYKEYGAIDVLKVNVYDTIPILDVENENNANDLLIKITASTVTIIDTFIRKGVYYKCNKNIKSLPISPGFDFIGIIMSIGNNVNKDEFNIGDKVIGKF